MRFIRNVKPDEQLTKALLNRYTERAIRYRLESPVSENPRRRASLQSEGYKALYILKQDEEKAADNDTAIREGVKNDGATK